MEKDKRWREEEGRCYNQLGGLLRPSIPQIWHPLDLSRIPNGDCLSNGGGASPPTPFYSPPRGHYTLEMFVDETD